MAVICDSCGKATQGSVGEAVTCVHCASRFLATQERPPRPAVDPRAATPDPAGPPPLVLPHEVMWILFYGLQVLAVGCLAVIPSGYNGIHWGETGLFLGLALLLGGWLSGASAILAARKARLPWGGATVLGFFFSAGVFLLFAYLFVLKYAMSGMAKG